MKRMVKADGRGVVLVGEYTVEKPTLRNGQWTTTMRRYVGGVCVEEVLVIAPTKDALDSRIFEVAYG